MILTALLNLIYQFLSFILSPILNFSDVVLSTKIATSIATASGYYHSLNSILPVDTLIEILSVSLTFEGLYLFYKLIMWVIKKIPTIN